MPSLRKLKYFSDLPLSVASGDVNVHGVIRRIMPDVHFVEPYGNICVCVIYPSDGAALPEQTVRNVLAETGLYLVRLTVCAVNHDDL